ncbi:DUF6318 family protein [Kineococcus sp. SYSU DK018]|uniref:DUF6318 family protein n=1 Tax=Kineococcus sp. SYSU DK018 TaxID=3383139 RepID=UPI003D7D6C07
MHPVTRTLLACALAAAAIALLGACGEEAPVAEPPPTAPASTAAAVHSPAVTQVPTASPTPTAPALPRPTFESAGFTEDDAIAFTGHYLNVLNYARATGDSDAIRAISEPDCGACESDAEVVDVAHARGLTWENKKLRFRSATIEHFDPAYGEAEVLMHMEASGGRLVNPDGSTLEELPASESDGSMQMKFHDNKWWIWEMPR